MKKTDFRPLPPAPAATAHLVRGWNHGYITVKLPEHQRAAKNGRVYEHILVAEAALGKPLAEPHQVHHVDEVKSNNQNDNLVVCEDQQYHFLLHTRMRAYQATGNPNAKFCVWCKGYENQNDITVCISQRKAGPYEWCYHRECQRKRSAHLRSLKKELTSATSPSGMRVKT